MARGAVLGGAARGGRIRAQDRGVDELVAAEVHAHVVGGLDHVGRRQDQTVLGHEHPATVNAHERDRAFRGNLYGGYQ